MSVRNDSIRSDDHANIPPHKYTNEYSNPESGSQNSINNENSGVENKSADEKIKLVEKPLPRNGSTIYYSTESRVAPLKIETSSEYSYFVKLEDYYTNKKILTVFIRPLNKIKIKVPLGSYIVKYAVGEKWYGEKYLFGPEQGITRQMKNLSLNLTGFNI